MFVETKISAGSTLVYIMFKHKKANGNNCACACVVFT